MMKLNEAANYAAKHSALLVIKFCVNEHDDNQWDVQLFDGEFDVEATNAVLDEALEEMVTQREFNLQVRKTLKDTGRLTIPLLTEQEAKELLMDFMTLKLQTLEQLTNRLHYLAKGKVQQYEPPSPGPQD
jgi:hypothetical protein